MICGPADCQDFTTWQVGFTIPLSMGTRSPLANTRQRSPLANTRQAQYVLLRSRACQQQIIHQATHSLARFFLEVDAHHEQYRQAQRSRAAAAQRLDAQHTAYEEGRVPIDRVLDAISQYANTMAQEAQHLSTYNITLAGLSEAKGTLLADRQIIVAAGPRPRRAAKIWHASTEKRDEEAKTASFQPEKNQGSRPTPLEPVPTTETRCQTVCCGQTIGANQAKAKATTWMFSITIGGPQSFHVKGTVTVDEPIQPDSQEP
jgi:hypothetical protein